MRKIRRVRPPQSCHGNPGSSQDRTRGTLVDVPEGMNIEVAHKLSEREQEEAKEKRRWQELAEIGEVDHPRDRCGRHRVERVSGSQMGRTPAFQYGTASRLRVQADEADTLGGQQRLLDVSTFNTWIQAHEEGNEKLAGLYVRRFSDEYRVAFDAWLKTHPFTNPDAPAGPNFMPEYHNAQTELAATLNEQADVAFEAGPPLVRRRTDTCARPCSSRRCCSWWRSPALQVPRAFGSPRNRPRRRAHGGGAPGVVALPRI